jgi:hypothetical protein
VRNISKVTKDYNTFFLQEYAALRKTFGGGILVLTLSQLKGHLDCLTLKLKALSPFETSGSTRSMAQLLIHKDLNLQQHHFENLKTGSTERALNEMVWDVVDWF